MLELLTIRCIEDFAKIGRRLHSVSAAVFCKRCCAPFFLSDPSTQVKQYKQRFTEASNVRARAWVTQKT